MDISFNWNIKDMKWDEASGMIFQMDVEYSGESICTVGSASTTFTHSILERLYLQPSDNPVGIDSITRDAVLGWAQNRLSAKIPFMKKEIYDIIHEKSNEYMREQLEQYYPEGNPIKTIGGGMGQNPNDNW